MDRGKRNRSPHDRRGGGGSGGNRNGGGGRRNHNHNARGYHPPDRRERAPFILDRPSAPYRCTVCNEGTHWAIECPRFRDSPYLYPDLGVDSKCFGCCRNDAEHTKQNCPSNSGKTCTACYGVHKTSRCPYAVDDVVEWIELFDSATHNPYWVNQKDPKDKANRTWDEPLEKDKVRWYCDSCHITIVHEKMQPIAPALVEPKQSGGDSEGASPVVKADGEEAAGTQGMKIVKTCPSCGFLRPRYAGLDVPLEALTTFAGKKQRDGIAGVSTQEKETKEEDKTRDKEAESSHYQSSAFSSRKTSVSPRPSSITSVPVSL